MLAPEVRWLELLAPAIAEDVDYYAVTPETLWAEAPGGGLRPNGFHARFAALREATNRPFVAHSVGMSLGAIHESEARRRSAFLARMREDHAVFDFAWWTDHLGLVGAAGAFLALPVALPATQRAARVVREVLGQMRAIVPAVGVENSALYFSWSEPLAEPAFIDACLDDPGSHLLLDLHNLHTSAQNLGFDPDEWLARADLSRVIEIHLSGGSESPAEWLRSGHSLRLDSHDDSVPEPVWSLLERVLPRCPGLRGVTLERFEGTIDAPDVPLVREELARIREMLGARTTSVERAHRESRALDEGDEASLRAHEEALAKLVTADDATTELARMAADAHLPAALRASLARVRPDGLELALLLVARLRYERLLAGSNEAGELADRDPRAFAETFRQYLRETPPTAFFPAAEAALFRAWLR
jgi:uncharacterized protein (UPF0276 family)